MSLRLGIDTGGTFTDAVLVDDSKNIVNAEKSLTTRFDLSLGIGDVVSKLPPASLAEVGMVSLSTTLTTNSVVEDLGAPVCVLLPGYSSEQVKQSGLLEILPAQFVIRLEGGFDAVGREHQPLDEAAGRVLAAALTADRDSPPADASAMDGYAVRLTDLDARDELPVSGSVEMGKPPPSLPRGPTRFGGGRRSCVRRLRTMPRSRRCVGASAAEAALPPRL